MPLPAICWSNGHVRRNVWPVHWHGCSAFGALPAIRLHCAGMLACLTVLAHLVSDTNGVID